VPGEGCVFEALIFFFEDFGLEIGVVVGGWRGVEFQIERDAERGFARADGPAGENVVGGIGRTGIVTFDEIDLMRADAYLRGGASDCLRDAQAAAPICRLDFVCGNVAGGAEIFAAGQAGYFDRWWMAEDFFFGAEGGGLAAREDEEIGAEAVGFLDIVRDEQSGAAVGAQRVEELVLDLRAEVRVERGERLVEKERFGSDG